MIKEKNQITRSQVLLIHRAYLIHYIQSIYFDHKGF